MLVKNDTGLIVVDVQGKLARLVHDSKSVVANLTKLIQGAKVLGLPILWLEQNPDKLGSTVEELSELLAGQSPITKFTFDAGKEPEFVSALHSTDVKTWLICGIEAHICVYQTATHLKNLGFEVELVADCVASRTKANKKLAISKLTSKGIGMTGLEMCLYELVGDCRTEEFKSILKLIK